MKIVAFFSQFGMGKDVASDYLADVLNQRNKTGTWTRKAFADAVKKIYQETFGVDRDFIEKWKRNPDPPTYMGMNVRKSLQFIGDGFRKIKSDVWVDIALRDKTKQLIISDGRYVTNEAKAVDYEGGINVVLYRPGFLNNDENESESQIRPILDWCCANMKKSGPIVFDVNSNDLPRGLEFFDYFILNDQDKQHLYNQIDNLLVPFVENKFNRTANV